MTRTSELDFGSDPAHQWDTKRKLFHLAEVYALPRAILFCAVLGKINTGDVLGEKRKGDGESNSDGDTEGKIKWGDGDVHETRRDEGDNERGD